MKPVQGQSTYLPLGSKHDQLLQRLEIKMQSNPVLNVSTARPFSRRVIDEAAESADSLSGLNEITLSTIDRYNIQSLLMNNTEWVRGGSSGFASKHPLWNTIYKTKANFFEVNEKDFFLAINPVLQEQQSVERDNSERLFVNTRGVTLRGLIADRVGFYTNLTENLERTPEFVQDRIVNFRAVPGNGRYNVYKNTGVDYSDARGGVTFNAAKYIDFQFAYDKNFIGDGYRSLFLSDYSSNYLFLKINTRIWKLNYQNIYMELNPQFPASVRGSDALLDKKYATIHHLSVNATRWLNLGLFEAVVFGRKNHFDFTYLNPIIFLRTAEKQNNSPDNGFVGLDFKANVLKRGQLYGQVLFDELKIKELVARNGWFGNKFGIQLGAKYIDAFGVGNLDLQGEINIVRPFTYSHYDSTDDYSHYNQPLAHPLGADFIEAIGIIKYQPLKRLTASARLIYWKQGLDSNATANYGSDIFKLYTSRSGGDYGYSLPSGIPSNGLNAQLLASYEIKENLFIDGSVLLRKLTTAGNYFAAQNTAMFTAGIRLNMFRREYDY
ncbi:MAG: hypothetical protein H0X41_01695 [Chitinophagaceae bacterium]|nr:hypothetical protein [Chitinophagaceae bacterium]